MPETPANSQQLEEALKNANLLKRSSKELADTIAQLQRANLEIKKSRRAALNVLEDSILSKKALQASEEKYRTLFNSIDQGFCIIEVLFDENEKAYDYRFIEANKAFEKQTGLINAIGKSIKELVPQHEQHWFDIYGKIAKTGEAERFENEAKALGHYYEVYSFRIGEAQHHRVAVLFNDITGRKKAEERQAYLLNLGDIQRQQNDPVKIQEMTAQLLGKYLEASRVLYAEISDDGEYALISSNYTHGVSSFTGKHRLKDFGPAFIRTLESGKTLVIPDIADSANLTETEKKRYAAINIAAQLVVSLRKSDRFQLALGVYQDTPRNWTDDEIALVEETAERSWIAIEKARAEKALRESEERLRITMESAVDFAIINTSVEGLVEGWNTGAEHIFGFMAEEIMNKPADIIFTPEDRENRVPEKEMATAREKGYAEDERWHQRKDGSRFYVSGIMRPIYNPELTGYVKVARDMTSQKRGEENLRLMEERNRIALQSAEMASWDWNINENKVAWNEQHHIILGVEPNHELKKAAYFLQFVHPEDKERITRALYDAVEISGVYKEELRIIRKDNQEIRWMSGFGRTVEWEDGKASRMVGVMFDITERKKLEQQKEDFISIASHELKTPVTSIKAYTELLQEMSEEDNYAPGATVIKKLDAQVDRLIALVHDLLDITKITEGELQLNLQEFELDALIAERVEDLQRLSNIHHFVISPGTKILVTADRERIGQVLTNLISNAIKYSPKGGGVAISAKKINDSIEISVRDEGIGIPGEMQKKVFDRFFRAKQEHVSTYPGMGLGLYIAANIIARHGGTINVESPSAGLNSKQAKGSRFYFTIPLTPNNHNEKHNNN